jgi:hypothetical protein
VPADACSALVDRALAHGLGARALHRVVSEVFAELEFSLPRLAEQGVGEVRMSRAAIEGRANPIFVHRRDLEGWVEPFPSAEQLCWGPPGTRRRSEPPRPGAREQPARKPRRPLEGPTLFENGG